MSGLTTGTWNQIVVTRQGPTLSICINGVVAGTLDYGSTAIVASTNPLLVGKRAAGDGRDFSVNGSIDQAAIWNRALSSTEVSGLFTSGGVISQ